MLSSRFAILAGLGLLGVQSLTSETMAKPIPTTLDARRMQLAQAGDTVTPFWMEGTEPAPEAAPPTATTEPEPVDTSPPDAKTAVEPLNRPTVAVEGRGGPILPGRKPTLGMSTAPPRTTAAASKPGSDGVTEPLQPADDLEQPETTVATTNQRQRERTAEPPSRDSGRDDGPPPGDRPILRADRVVFDEDLSLVTATGRVELSRLQETVYADTVSYNLRTNIVTATGNVRIFQSTGDIIFADYAEITGDLRDAFIDRAAVLFATGERMVGNEAEQTEGRYLRISRGVFSPCNLCKEDPEAAPIWQVRAEKIVRDKQDLEVRYRNMTMDFFGVPIFWTPYFSHADPTVDRKTGFLAPDWGSSADFGYFFTNYYYLDLAPNRDATLGLAVFEQAFPLFSLEVRNRFERGFVNLFGSVTHESVENLETGGQGTQNDQLRGSLSGTAEYHIDENWRAGGNLESASDFNFHRQYLVEPSGNFLESRGYLEGFFDRDYASLEVLRYQSVLPEASRNEPEPVVFPLAQYQILSDPNDLLGGRWSLDLGLRGISREEDGTDSNRFSVLPSWERRLIYGPGLVTDVTVESRADVYSFSERESSTTGERNTDSTFRVIPRGQVLTGFPFVRDGDQYDQYFSPTVGITAAKDQDDPEFPIEDGEDGELRSLNLFGMNRFLGTDLQEGGVNAVYGARYGITSIGGGNAEFFLGQNYRLSGTPAFPDGSGLESDESDYIGYINIQPERWLDLYYDFRHDHNTLERERQTIQATVGGPPLQVSGSYDFLVQSGGGTAGEAPEQEYATFGVGAQLTRYWSVGISHSQTLAPVNRALSSTGVLSYRDECVDFSAVVTRDNSDVPGISNELSFTFRVVLKHIGEVALRDISTSLLGGGTDETQ